MLKINIVGPQLVHSPRTGSFININLNITTTIILNIAITNIAILNTAITITTVAIQTSRQVRQEFSSVCISLKLLSQSSSSFSWNGDCVDECGHLSTVEV